MLLHHPDDLGGSHSIGVVFVRRAGRMKAGGIPDITARRVVDEQGLFLRMVNPVGIHRTIPGRLVVHTVGSDLGRYGVMINLADARGKIAVLLKKLWKRH